MIQIIPAIDLIEGRCVRLSQGDYGSRKIYDGDPADLAARYADCGVGRIHLVDLDGAKAGSPRNLRTLERIALRVDVELEWGGGLSSSEALLQAFDAGATQAIIGSVAAREPDLFRTWLRTFGGSRVLLGADVRDGRIAVKGWLEDTLLGIEDMVECFLPDGLQECICTDIGRDGMLSGPSFALYPPLQERFPDVSFTVSGGISSMDDIRRLDGMGLRKVIAGKALYEHRITLKEIESWSLNASSPASM
ncbi:MAG: 1-(5-phosphoribosyl)-5-[Bacteroidales bacterium]|nr:1-(5-phosphoribosyl)-5-[(5-phosphoribosylamino)methylideneamino]imidazole-4-carboxamide isomerase [Bacteroidales bacterium]